jgi:ABC-type antimicrobial peptide transport system permease subunit
MTQHWTSFDAQVNAESRQFELAVRRMLGSQRSSVVLLLLAQAFSYGIPAWIVGLLVSQVCHSITFDLVTGPSGFAVGGVGAP